MNPIEAWLSSYPATTRGLYSRTVASFIAATHRPVTEATQDDVARYHAALSELAPATVATKLAILASLFSYLQKRGIRADNPMVAIAHRPKVDKQGSVEWLDEDEQRTLLAFVGGDNHSLDARNKAMVWILLHGLRLAELVSLDAEDYRYGELRFTGKGGKSRIVPLLAPAQIALQHHLGNRRSGPIFRVKRHRISPRQVQRIVQSMTEQATGRRLHPHSLRHSFATRHVRAGTGLPQLQKLMGHAALSSTNLYIHLNTDDVREAMDNDPLNEKRPLALVDGGKVTLAG